MVEVVNTVDKSSLCDKYGCSGTCIQSGGPVIKDG